MILHSSRRSNGVSILISKPVPNSLNSGRYCWIPQFKRRIGLVAIDECHVIDQWKDFRSEFTLIYELRRTLSTETVLFAAPPLSIENPNSLSSKKVDSLPRATILVTWRSSGLQLIAQTFPYASVQYLRARRQRTSYSAIC